VDPDFDAALKIDSGHEELPDCPEAIPDFAYSPNGPETHIYSYSLA